MHLIMEQQMVLFYKRVLKSSNDILQTLLCLKQNSVNSRYHLLNSAIVEISVAHEE